MAILEETAAWSFKDANQGSQFIWSIYTCVCSVFVANGKICPLFFVSQSQEIKKEGFHTSPLSRRKRWVGDVFKG